jgi:hypothetical protein
VIGRRLAIGDGVGSTAAASAYVMAGADPASLDLLLGWVPIGQLHLDLTAFASVRTVMGGYALRGPIDLGHVHYVTTRLGMVPALLHGALRCDTLIASVVAREGGYVLTTESAWMRAAIHAGAQVLGIERQGVPVLDGGPPIPADRVQIVATSEEPPAVVLWGEPGDVHGAIGEHVAALIPEGARVQYGPGPVGTAVLDAIRRPVHIDTGMLTDAVVDLDRRGLLLGQALAPYAGGTELLYDWAPDRARVDRLEITHDPVRLAADPPLYAINTALEIDRDGQVNV